jgi:hypothetical protein
MVPNLPAPDLQLIQCQLQGTWKHLAVPQTPVNRLTGLCVCLRSDQPKNKVAENPVTDKTTFQDLATLTGSAQG